ncbi:MAG: choice-of-anchor D domain-containing protein, partial [Acidobacteriaceae bacterium]|nr:choice-of-anchor D domain-containing protein [Acidobacteriaceae bacterium]
MALLPAMCQTSKTTINLATQGRNPDFSKLPFTRPVTVGTTLPATCQVGQLFFNSAATAGANLFGCTAVNVWTLESGNGAASTSPGGSTTPSGTPSVSLSTANVTFTGQNTGTTSATQPVTLSNTGTAALTISGIALNGTNAADFKESDTCGTSVAANANCTITISFTPSIVGSESASIAISDNAAGSPHMIALNGTGSSAPPANSSNGPVLSAGSGVASPASPLTITSDRAVTWSLAPGSVGTITPQTSGNTAIYTPPSGVSAQHSIAGCMVAPNDSVFNTRIDNLPVHSSSDTWINAMGPNAIRFGFSWGLNLMDNSLAAIPQVFHYTTQYNGNFQIMPRPNRKRETGSLTWDGNNDHHMISMNRQTCHFVETYQDGTVPPNCPTCISTASGWQYDGTSNAAPPNANYGGGTTDAAGLPLEPLTLHLSEIRSGAINHAMRFTLCIACINSNLTLWPGTSGNGSNSPNSPPMGARFRLKTSYPVTGVTGNYVTYGGSGYTTAPTLTFHGCTVPPTGYTTLTGTSVQWIVLTSSGSGCVNPTVEFSGPGWGAQAQLFYYSPAAQVILKALQQYGIFLADIGSSGELQASTDITSDPSAVTAFDEIARGGIGFSNFEAVDESSLMISPDSNRVNPFNGYVTPANYAIVQATDSQGNQTSMPIAVEPVMVGTPYPTMTVQAGMPGYQMQSWVTGSTNQSVTWTLTSGVGSMTAGGVYTPPADVSDTTQAVLTVAAAADPTATATVYLTVIPVGANPTGSIRVDVGSSNPYTDSQGNVWLADTVAQEMGSYSVQNDNYPAGLWGNVVDAPLYQTYKYTWGDDIVYGPFVVPNGNYKVAVIFAQGGCSGTYGPNLYDNGLTNGQFALESQGRIGA